MSDQPPAPGWWKASDGNWYPPQPPAGYPPPAAAANANKGCLIAALVGLAIFVLITVMAVIVIAFLGTTAVDKAGEIEAKLETLRVDPANPDAQEGDKVAAIGQSVELSGYTTTVDNAGFVAKISDFETAGYLVADVTIVNRDDQPQPFNIYDWTLQTPDGQIRQPSYVSAPDQLGSASLVKGGRVSGKVAWALGPATGDYFVIYRPDLLNADRGIWTVTING
jgi:hypothetical protein